MKVSAHCRLGRWPPLVLLVAFLWIGCDRGNRSRPAAQLASGESVEVQVGNWLAERARLDRTLFQPELQALECEQVFVRLWDDLRASSNAWGVLEAFPWPECILPSRTGAEPVTAEIQQWRLGAPLKSVARESALALLQGWRESGWQLEQSEWRQIEFDPPNPEPARSRFWISLHLARPVQETRLAVRGTVDVTWSRAGLEWLLLRIDARGLEVIERTGELPFEHVVAAELPAVSPSAAFLEPTLQLYDLNADGLSEIILPRHNQIFWNRGQGVFRPDALFSGRSAPVSTGVIADFNGDTRPDYLAADPSGVLLFPGAAQGGFEPNPQSFRLSPAGLGNPFVITAGDIDQDGDLDAWLGQYKVPYAGGQMPTPYFNANDGYPAYLIENDGHGNFRDVTRDQWPVANRYRRVYSAAFVDLNRDSKLDLLVAADFAGFDAYLNDGHGRFVDATHQLFAERRAFGMALACGDFNNDAELDLLGIGMNSPAAGRLGHLQLGRPGYAEYDAARAAMSFGNRLFFARGPKYVEGAVASQIARTGWSWGVTAGDFDRDGDLDFYVGNGHISGRSAREYESEFWRHDIYEAESKESAARARYFDSVQERYRAAGASYGGFEKNRLFLNLGERGFLEAGYLLGVSLEADTRNVVSEDLDGDGKLDLIVTTLQVFPELRQRLHIFPNFWALTQHWIGVQLEENGPGFSPLGARVFAATASGVQIRTCTTGDSYRSQHAPTAYFGLGTATEVPWLKVVWPNGVEQTLQRPALDQYHRLRPAAPRPRPAESP